MAMLLGLLAAVLWGVTDFLAQRAGRAAGIHRTMFYGQLLGTACLGGWILSHSGQWTAVAQAPLTAWSAAVLAALIGLCATMSLYRALLTGRIGIVAPIAASYGAVGAVLSAASGEPVSAALALGLCTCIVGVVLSARPPRPPSDAATERADGRPVLWAGVAAVAYGVQFWIQGRFATPHLGPVVPVFLYYAVGLCLFLAAARRGGVSLGLPRGPVRLLVLATATVAVGGYVALSAGLATGEIAVVTVLSSFQSGVTVLLAAIVLREPLGRSQTVGTALVIAGLALIHAFTG